jgi:protein SCO1/2
VIPLSKTRRRVLLGIAACVCALFAVFVCVLVGRKPAPPTIATILKEVGFDQHLGDDVPLDLVFQDEHGRDVTLGTYFGEKPVVLSFVYYRCPMLCTQVLDGLVRSLRSMSLEPGRDFEVVTVSIDARDTSALAAEKKANYLKEYANPAAESAWHFLTSRVETAPVDAHTAASAHSGPAGASAVPTGSSAVPTGSSAAPTGSSEATASASTAPTGTSAALLAKRVGFRYFYDASVEQFAHASGVAVLTGKGSISKYFYGIEYSPRDLRLALVEASAGEIGTWMDQALLLCYHYDPMTGTYGIVILTIIRALGILTVLAIAGLLFALLRRERRLVAAEIGGS